MDGKKPHLVAIIVQSIYAGMFLLSKAALNNGLNNFIFIFYRQAAATVVLVPVAVLFKRKEALQLSLVVFIKMFMLALFGITCSLNLYGVGLIYTSSTLAAATTNTLPATTFLLAVLLRMEDVKLKSLSGKAKVVGIIACLAGAMTYAFYKGPHFNSFSHHYSIASKNSHVDEVHTHSSETWLVGSFLLLAGNILWCLWTVLQGQVLKDCPSKLLFTTIQCFLSTVQSFIVAIAFEPNLAQWKLNFDIGLLAIAYCGIVVTGITFYLQAWVIEKMGPVFLAMFTPLSLAITIICSMLFLGEVITLGSVLGGALMVAGLYSVLWGKSKEQMNAKVADDGTKGSIDE
ncbi:WAT1-related protein At5g64700-like isoform X2 [Tasmannia lanceolata]|uniref:WAT1-related protein At5g64700-like isoform X2 n=1 Tax=Tasmannia lanceolata TaxID=3420 RepID=UPI0040633D96